MCRAKRKKRQIHNIKNGHQSKKDFLNGQRRDGEKLHLTFEISGEAGYRHDALINLVDSITVSNPTRMTWIYRTAKKNDRIDSRKQAVLLSIGEVPKVHHKGA